MDEHVCPIILSSCKYGLFVTVIMAGGCNLQNVERNYSLLGQRKYIHARLNPNPNPLANHKPYPNPKILNVREWKVFMASIPEKLAIYVFLLMASIL